MGRTCTSIAARDCYWSPGRWLRERGGKPIGLKKLEAGLCYTRRDAFRSEETVSDRRHGAHLPRLLRANEPYERTVGDSDEGTILVQQYPSAAAEGLPAGLRERGIRYLQAHVSRQTF